MSTLEGPWDGVVRALSRLDETVDRHMRTGMKRAAMFLEGEIKRGIIAQAPGGQAFKPLAEATKRKRLGAMSQAGRRKYAKQVAAGTAGEMKALIDSGSLIAAITHQMASDGKEAFVGVLRSAVRKNDQSSGKAGTLVNIAAVHEFGVTINVKGHAITIPARPYIRPTFDAKRDETGAVFRSALEDAIKETASGVGSR